MESDTRIEKKGVSLLIDDIDEENVFRSKMLEMNPPHRAADCDGASPSILRYKIADLQCKSRALAVQPSYSPCSRRREPDGLGGSYDYCPAFVMRRLRLRPAKNSCLSISMAVQKFVVALPDREEKDQHRASHRALETQRQ